MDEPLSNLDAAAGADALRLLKLHKRVGRTTIYVTHDQIEAMTMADRIVVLRDGVMQQVGTPSEVYNAPPTFIAIFVGSPPMNLIPAVCLTADGGQRFQADRSISLPWGRLLAPARRITLGVRPEKRRTEQIGGCGRHPRPRRADRGRRRRYVPVRRRRRGHDDGVRERRHPRPGRRPPAPAFPAATAAAFRRGRQSGGAAGRAA